MTTSIDAKGIRRGACQDPTCEECEEYVYNPERGMTCEYCGCYPTKHRKIEVYTDSNETEFKLVEDIDKNNSKSSTSNSMSLSDAVYELDSEVVDVIHLTEIPHVKSRVSTSTPYIETSEINSFHLTNDKENNSVTNIISKLSKKEQYQLCVPMDLPDDSKLYLATQNKLSASQRQFILRWVVTTMRSYRLLDDRDYIEVATLLVQQYPEIQCNLNKGIAGVIASMKEIVRNHKHYIVRKMQRTSSGCPSVISQKKIELGIAELKQEMSSQNPSLMVMKAILSTYRVERKEKAKKESCAMHLKSFPCLEREDIIFWEFCQQENINLTKNDLKMKWVNLLPKMLKFFTTKTNEIPVFLSQGFILNT